MEITGTHGPIRQLRDAVRTRYKRTRRLTEMAMRDPLFNPGAAWVSKLSAEPVVFREVLDDLVRPAQTQGLLRCLMRHRPLEAVMAGDQVAAVRFEDLESGERLTITPATSSTPPRKVTCCRDRMRVGDGCGVRREYRRATRPGRPSGSAGPAGDHAGALPWSGDRARTTPSTPGGHEFWQNYRADFWPGPQLGWLTQEPESGKPLNRPLFSESGEQDLWTFRRIRTAPLHRWRLRVTRSMAQGRLLAHSSDWSP